MLEVDADSPWTETVVTLSTAHVTRRDDELLRKLSWQSDERNGGARAGELLPGPVVFAYDAGFFVRLSDEDFGEGGESELWFEPGLSDALVGLLREAWKWGHRWVRLDRDGPVVAGMETFDW